ncbi:MAG TPA: HlyD family efflux transporter periplasmic adaptor subunit, partial [Candidatus Polarisedimenticolia bacterium]|nr:HlyD family efflux transporter periplasmic adaptor subunit [Candidatus Polarisedimenticolia bacterium]
KLGEQVIIGTMNNPGTVILVLSDMSEMLAEVKVDETEVADIRPGQKAVVSVDAIEERKYDGDVTEIAHTALKERDVSRFAVKVSLSASPEHSGPAADRELPLKGVPDPAGGALAELRPGMTAHAAIHVALKKDALVVPIQAVIEKKRKDLEAEKKKGESSTADGSVASETPKPEGTGRNDVAIADEAVDVLFVDRAGKVEMLEVKTGLSDEFNVEILGSPLQAGDKVVIGPYRTLKKLKNGDAIVRVEKDEDLKKDES